MKIAKLQSKISQLIGFTTDILKRNGGDNANL